MVNNIELYGFLQGGWQLTEIITDGDNQTIYQAKATGDLLTSSPVWCIKRTTITVSGGVQLFVEEFADGDMNYDNVWNDRFELTYKLAK